MYVYVYLYTGANPCIPCTKQGGTENRMMPKIDEHEAAFFERSFRKQATNAPHGCVANVGRCGVCEQSDRAPWRSRASSSGYFERPGEADRARSRTHQQVRCFRARPRTPVASEKQKIRRPLRNFSSIDIYIYIYVLVRTRAFHAQRMFVSVLSATTSNHGPALRSVSE